MHGINVAQVYSKEGCMDAVQALLEDERVLQEAGIDEVFDDACRCGCVAIVAQLMHHWQVVPHHKHATESSSAIRRLLRRCPKFLTLFEHDEFRAEQFGCMRAVQVHYKERHKSNVEYHSERVYAGMMYDLHIRGTRAIGAPIISRISLYCFEK